MSDKPTPEQQIQEIYFIIAGSVAKSIEHALTTITQAVVEHIKTLDIEEYVNAQQLQQTSADEMNRHQSMMEQQRAAMFELVNKQNKEREARHSLLQAQVSDAMAKQQARSTFQPQGRENATPSQP